MKRNNLKTLLPHVVRRIHAAEFASQTEMAREYGIDKATATKWKRRAFVLGLSDSRAWHRGFLLGQVSAVLGSLGAPACRLSIADSHNKNPNSHASQSAA